MSFCVLNGFLLSSCTLHNQKIERAIEYIGSGESIEATPKSLRLRKRILEATARERMSANIILNAARGPSARPIKLSQRSCLQNEAGCC
jgi:TypA/BipA-like protein